MKFLNEFIFDDFEEAMEFHKEIFNIKSRKGYLTYGDVCKAYYKDIINYNDYSIYKNNGWINSIMSVNPRPYGDDKWIIIMPPINNIKNIRKDD